MTLAVLMANPQVPEILNWLQLLDFGIWLALFVCGVVLLVRAGWRKSARMLMAFIVAVSAALPMVFLNVIVICGFCCEWFWEWLCAQ